VAGLKPRSFSVSFVYPDRGDMLIQAAGKEAHSRCGTVTQVPGLRPSCRARKSRLGRMPCREGETQIRLRSRLSTFLNRSIFCRSVMVGRVTRQRGDPLMTSAAA
jgi:hypothetical protein